MKKGLFTIILLFSVLGVSAQKEVRDSIRTGNKAFLEQRYNVAESNFKSAIVKDPTAKEASYNLANTYYKQNRFDEAIAEYGHYLTLEHEKNEDIGAAYFNMGNSFLKKKDLQKAEEAYKNALRANPKDEDARYNLAVVKKMKQDQENQNDDQQQDDKQDQKQDQQDQKDDKKDDKQDQKDQDQKKDKKPEEQQQEEQLSQDNARQMLQAIEQDEKETQEKVRQMKAAELQKQNEENRRQNKDW
ncbi:tetratricopeptide repeat protein [Dysgonomonas sp. 216]|uniref:tetratricopeptide repeat protein n=1 Tax=Dysgonomonas sp. 216 TaxID=2302934 RepID=UPI0013D0E02C|nr:tetratricopeptide repeat protein [Dysgonomonas sp. 216]NDW17332.1 tetratricopeptide repeat protein [Dysgonomonas sp. 216]